MLLLCHKSKPLNFEGFKKLGSCFSYFLLGTWFHSSVSWLFGVFFNGLRLFQRRVSLIMGELHLSVGFRRMFVV